MTLRRGEFTLKQLLVAVFLLSVAFTIAGIAWRAINDARQKTRESNCCGQFRYLQIAMANYESVHGHFPPAYVAGPDGTPWHSWRVLLMPYMGGDMQQLSGAYSFDEPWDGPNNKKLMQRIDPSVFQCRNGPDYGTTKLTNYVVVVGPKTLFPGESVVALNEVGDVSKVLSIVEIENSDIHWMEPRDLLHDEIRSPRANSPRIGGPHPSGACAVSADAMYEFLSRDTQPKKLAERFRIKSAQGQPSSERPTD